jgi:hypothetical protein
MTPKLSNKQLLFLATILALALLLTTSYLLPPLIAHWSTAPSTALLDPPIEPQAYPTDNVTIFDLSFNPCCLCVEKGDTINWTNNDPLIHTLYFALEDKSTYLLSDPILPGESWSHTFTESQKLTLTYYSFDRLWITGNIRVYIILGDIDGDSDVDSDDFYLFAGVYGTSPPSNPWCNLDCDGDVDSDDFYIFAGKYGSSYP